MNAILSIILGAFSILAAAGLLAGAGIAYARQQAKLNAGRAAEGIVVALERRSAHPGRTGVYCPVVEFTPPSGQTVRFESDFGARPASHRIGQTVSVRYDPANPQKAEIDSGLTRLLVPGILFGMSVVSCCLGSFFVTFGAIFY